VGLSGGHPRRAVLPGARGSNVCQFGSFDYASDAENFAARNFGGKGSPCSCR